MEDFGETHHKYRSCEWELLKGFQGQRSKVKGQGHVYRCVNLVMAEVFISVVSHRGCLV